MQFSISLKLNRLGAGACFLVMVALIPLASALLVGCAEDLTARGDPAMPFSIYGVISPDLPVQSIRVYPHEDVPALGTSPLDADVFSTDLDTGERVVWRDSVLVDQRGQHEYVYWAPFRAQHGHEYRVEVIRRSDGARTHADVRVPEPVTVRILDDRNVSAMPVLIEGNDIRALKPEVVYDIDVGNCTPLRNRFSYPEVRVEGGWEIRVHLVIDHDNILWGCSGGTTHFASGPCPNLRLRNLELHALVGDSAWNPPGGTFDVDELSQPGVMSNVENGFGFVGSGYRIQAELRLPRESLNRACFIDG